MKIQRSFEIALVACVMWFTSHEAYAFYNPSTGRWLSRDPIEEKGGMNPYCFNCNDGVRRWDYLGLLVGDVDVKKNAPLVSLFRYGWEIELEWRPPVAWNDRQNNCIPCRRAVWVQDYKYDIDLIWPWSDTHTGWVKDWDETSYSGSAYEWMAGNRSASNSWMHDEPS
ncbi:MAG: RHS repeat-associated core domain-containing protein, partial [Fimbriimonadaceae bacterium]